MEDVAVLRRRLELRCIVKSSPATTALMDAFGGVVGWLVGLGVGVGLGCSCDRRDDECRDSGSGYIAGRILTTPDSSRP